MSSDVVRSGDCVSLPSPSSGELHKLRIVPQAGLRILQGQTILLDSHSYDLTRARVRKRMSSA